MTEQECEKLSHEVDRAVYNYLADGIEVFPEWLTEEIIKVHRGTIEGPGVQWFLQCAYTAIRTIANGVVRKYKLKPEKDTSEAQTELPFYNRIQRAYCITRDGQQVIVPFKKITRAEWKAKATELRGMSVGCALHAEQIDRYVEEFFDSLPPEVRA